MKSTIKVTMKMLRESKLNSLGLCALVLSLLSLLPAQAQVEQGDIRASLGLAYGSKAGYDFDKGDKTGGIGITPAVEYIFLENTGANLSYDFFFKSEKEVVSLQLSSLNLDLRRYFIVNNIQLYGLAGVAFLTLKGDEGGGIKESNSETEFNLGLGAVFQLADNLGVNPQVKYVTGIKQAAINAGVVYSS